MAFSSPLGAYLIWYGVGRAWFESFRLDPTGYEVLGVKINIITAVAVAVIGAAIIVVQARRRRRRNVPTPSNAVADVADHPSGT